MNRNLSKVELPIGVNKRSTIPLESYHITSGDFFLFKPVHYHHCIPGEHYIAPVTYYTLLDPVTVPTFGKIVQKVKAFFVPYRLVYPAFNEWVSETYAFASQSESMTLSSHLPVLKPVELMKLFTTLSYNNATVMDAADVVDTGGKQRNYDFKWQGNYYKLTIRGLRVLTLFESLGYRAYGSDKQQDMFNALAFLGLVRVYCDWFANSSYLDSNAYLSAMAILNRVHTSGYHLSASDLYSLTNLILYVKYDQDYFTAAFDNPDGPNGSVQNQQVIPDYTLTDTVNDVYNYSNSNIISNNYGYNNTPSLYGVDNPSHYPKPITQFALQALDSMSKYYKKFQLVGSRAADRLLALYGKKPSSDALNRSYYLGEDKIEISLGKVMTTADTEQGSTGDYAGQGEANGQHTFDIQVDEAGVFIIVSSLLPSYDYYQGFDRHNLHMQPTDFWNPLYDNLGCQAICRGELYVSDSQDFITHSGSVDDLAYTKVFGYSMRYAEYKISKSYVTGRYRSEASMDGASSWHLMRTFYDDSFGSGLSDNVIHSLDFTMGSIDANNYDRIFDNTDDYDHFNQMFYVGAVSKSPALSLFESYDWHDDDGKVVQMSQGGTSLN